VGGTGGAAAAGTACAAAAPGTVEDVAAAGAGPQDPAPDPKDPGACNFIYSIQARFHLICLSQNTIIIYLFCNMINDASVYMSRFSSNCSLLFVC
jgi:hypothetical protein